MSAHMLLYLFKGMRKAIKGRAFYHFFTMSLVKFNNTRARMVDSNYHMTLNYFEIIRLA